MCNFYSFNAEIGDLLSWLSEVDSVVVASKPVGGLPETATEQLERFMVSFFLIFTSSFTWISSHVIFLSYV